MMNEFLLYFSLGLQHILDWEGYDHILFILALIAVYESKAYYSVFILITAFTIGHSLALALSVFDYIHVPTELVEFLIPLTIVITAITNLFLNTDKNQFQRLKYGIALLFGCIHGLGFSNYLKSLLGSSASIFRPLLSFNLGLELGQLLIVLLIFAVNYLIFRLFSIQSRDKLIFISGAAFGLAFVMMVERLIKWLNGL